MPPKLAQHRTLTKSLGRTLVAGLVLLVLFASWLPHDHETAGASPHGSYASSAFSFSRSFSRVFFVTTDDSHHTHSSALVAEDLPCALCRSAGEREKVAALEAEFRLPEHALLGSRPLFREPSRKPGPHARRYRGRAPPLALPS